MNSLTNNLQSKMKYSITLNPAVKSFHTSLARSMAYITIKEWFGIKGLTIKEWLGLKDKKN